MKWVPDTRTLVVLADGEVGELMIVGEHVAAGYYNAVVSSLAGFSGTSSAFVENPFLSLSSTAGTDRCAINIRIKDDSGYY